MTKSFTNRSEYLAYRAQWKAQYAQLSEHIRAKKLAIKDADRKGEYSGMLHTQLRSSRNLATEMLEQLKEARAEANRQYLAAREERKVA